MDLHHLIHILKETAARVKAQAEAIIHPPRVRELSPTAVLAAIPGELVGALDAAGGQLEGGREVFPAPETGDHHDAVKTLVPAGEVGEVVGVSSDENGVLQWHIPGMGAAAQGQVEMWLRTKANQARRLALYRFPGAATLALAREAEKALKPVVGLKKLPAAAGGGIGEPPFPHLSQVDALQPGGRTLLLVHGILDRVFGFIFSPLLLHGDLLARLHAHYGGRVYGYEHRTISEGPLQNARDLLELLPDRLQVDIICHSRGGLVVRALLEHPDVRARLDAKGIDVGQVIFVGAANQGSDLARRDNLARLLTIFTTHGARSTNPLVRATSSATAPLMVAVARLLAARGDDLPGVAALVPESDLIRELNESPVSPAGSYSFVRANFGDTTEPLLRLLEPISDEGFGSKLNDLVVPLAGMDDLGRRNASGRPRLTLTSESVPQGHWYHLNYFDSPDVLGFVVDRLGVP